MPTTDPHELVLWNNGTWTTLCRNTSSTSPLAIIDDTQPYSTEWLNVGGIRALLEETCAETFLLEFVSEDDTWLLVKPAGQRSIHCTEEGTHEPMLGMCPVFRNEFLNCVMDYDTVRLILPERSEETP